MRKLVLAAALACTASTLACAGWLPRAVERRVVVIGFDGMDPDLARRWIAEGRLPHLASLAEAGGLHDLETTPSPSSAMAWASFATGSNAGKHNVFDDTVRDPATYRAAFGLASRSEPRFLFNFLRVAREEWTSARGGTSFWTLAGSAGVRSSILAVPVTFPPEDVPNGELLAGAPLPDIRETPGTYHYFATDLPAAEERRTQSGSVAQRLVFAGRVSHAQIIGPRHPITGAERTLPMAITWNHEARSVNIALDGRTVYLREREWSRWIELEFPIDPLTRIRGMAQLFLLRAGTDLQLYLSPIHWHPADPPSPISSPASFALDLYDRLGHFRTLGSSGAIAALDEERLDEAAFLEDLDRAFQDRAETILNRLDVSDSQLVVGVIDTLDHLQHMMWRLVDPQHPRYDAELARRYAGTIEQGYQQADAFVGEVLQRVTPGTVVMVVSAHGFQPFRATVNLNAWLVQNGYLTVENGQIVWPRTRAYAIGAGQIFVNLQGREAHGVVRPGEEQDAVIDALARDLQTLADPRSGTRIVRRVMRRAEIYSGPFAANAPDLQVGLAAGYRASDGMTVSTRVVEPNLRKWSGEHVSADPQLTGGVLIANVPLSGRAPRVIDIGPTVLQLFDVPVPADMDGRPLLDHP